MTSTIVDTAELLARAESVTLTASLIFDLTDAYAATQNVFGANPRPMGSLRFSFIESGTGTNAAQKLDPPVELSTIANPSGYRLWFGRRADGGAPPDPGPYQLRIDSEYYAPFVAPAAVNVPAPDRAVAFALQPGYAYPFADGGLVAPGIQPTLLRGVLQNPDGTGQMGASVAVTVGADALTYLTDSTGQFVLVIPDPVPASVSVEITDAAGNKTSVADLALTAGATTVLPQTVLTGRVVGAASGSTVQLKALSLSTNVAPDGRWRIVLPPNQAARTVSVSARVPGRRAKNQSKIAVTPGQVVTVPDFVFR